MQHPNEIELVQQVNRVDIPPFLFTRIQSRIEAQLNEQLPIRWVWFSLSTLLLLIVVNTLILHDTTPLSEASNSSGHHISREMGMQTSNQLY